MSKPDNFISKLIASIGITLLFSIIFLVVYAPVIKKDFYYELDYVYLGSEGERTHIMSLNIIEGRILNGFLLSAIVSNIRASNSNKTARLVGIIGMSLFAFVMWAIFKRFQFRSDHAFLMSALICTLPHMQINFLWNSCIFYSYSAFLSSLSALILFNVINKEGNERRANEILGFLTAIILLVTSLTIYQSAAMMYWVIGVIFVLTGNNNDFLNKYRRPFVKYLFVGLASIVVYYFVFVKIVPFVMNISVDRGTIVTIHRLPVKLIKFLIIPLKNAINLWNIYPTYKFALFVSMIIFSDIIIGLLQAIKEKKQFLISNYRQKYFLIFCLLTLSYFPSLIVAEDAYTYRTLISLGAALSILFCFGLINIVEFFRFIPNFSAELRKTAVTVLLTVLVVVTALMARHNATHWPSPVQLDIILWEKWHIG